MGAGRPGAARGCSRLVPRLVLLALLIHALAAGPAQAGNAGNLRSPDLAPGQTWTVVMAAAGNEHYHCHQHPTMGAMIQVEAGGPSTASVTISDDAFSPAIVLVAPGGTVTWTNVGNATHSVAFEVLDTGHDEAPNSNLNTVVVTFLVGGALLSAVLLVFAVRSFTRTRDPSMAFVAGAFTMFMLKDALVAYSLQTGLIPHETLELVDATGDLGTVLLLVIPIFWSRAR